MNKEEFKNLIDTLDFEEIECAKITYYKKKPNSYSYNNSRDYEPKTFCIGQDLEFLINELDHKIDVLRGDIYDMQNQ